MCGPTKPSEPSAEDSIHLRDLTSLLSALKKERFLAPLVDIGIDSVGVLASTPMEKLSTKKEEGGCGLPKMVARAIGSTAAETVELYEALASKGKTDQYAALVTGDGVERVRTLEELAACPIERLSPPFPRLTVRMLQKAARERIESRPLRQFLVSVGKAEKLDALTAIGLKSPENIRDCDAELLSDAVGRMMARILKKRAAEAFPPPPEEPPIDSGPDYQFCAQVFLSPEARKSVSGVWQRLRSGVSASFGTRFYELLIALDANSLPCFSGVSLATVGREFDRMLDKLVGLVEMGTEEGDAAFRQLSDSLVGRLTRYRVPCQTLWLGDAAFEMAAVSVCPELEMGNEGEADGGHQRRQSSMLERLRHQKSKVGCWKEFYRALIPPLHPTLLRAAALPTEEEWRDLRGTRFHESFARRGYLYLTMWLVSEEHSKTFLDSLANAVEALRTWQDSGGSWSAFKEAGRVPFAGMEEEMALEFCILASTFASENYGPELGAKFGNALKVLACTVYGIERLSGSYRAIQRETVWDQWNDIYRFTSNEFGERFYERFTRDPMIKVHFRDTKMSMQRQRFVHQLNSALIRIKEDVGSEVRPMLLQLGARHRAYYNIGKLEMMSVTVPITDTLKEMIGRSRWRANVADSWAYVMTMIQNYLLVGWAYGVTILENDKEAQFGHHPVQPFDPRTLRAVRDDSMEAFQLFFPLFAKEIGQEGENGKRAAARYLGMVNSFLDEPDMSLARDHIQALGRRHRIYHDVTVETLAKASHKWMSSAKTTFGKRFSRPVALDWARLWELVAVGMAPDYKAIDGPAPTFEQLTCYYMPRTSSTRTLLKTVDPEKVVLTLMEKKAYPNDTCVLRFHSSELIEMKAGHFVKLRFSLPNGKSASRFYSVASCPCPVYGDTEELEFLIKEVKGGKVSPYIAGNGMGSMELYDNCELLTVAGGFVLPEPADGTCRLMVSAGVGIVAFMSAVRSVVARVEKGLVKQKIMLSLIHSERKLTFPFLDELLTISKRFSNHDLFTFDLTLCCTGKQEDARALGKLRRENPWMTVKSERVERELLSSAINKFPEPSELPVFGCGPRGFQKMVRETVLKQLGHKRSLMHLEFFDL